MRTPNVIRGLSTLVLSCIPLLLLFTPMLSGASPSIADMPTEESPIAASADLIYEGFETTDDLNWWSLEKCCDYSIQLDEAYSRDGSQSARFELLRDDPDVSGSRRVELTSIKNGSAPIDSVRWYGVSYYVPSDYGIDPTFEIVSQWHSRPDDCNDPCDWGSPPMHISITGNQWKGQFRYDYDGKFENNTPDGIIELETELGSVARDQWTDFVFQVRWSQSDAGFLKIWKNGTLAYDYQGPIGFNRSGGHHMKVGIYKPPYKYDRDSTTTDKRVLWIDSVRIGDETASYEDVAPGNNDAAPAQGLRYALYENDTLSGTPIKTGIDTTVDWNWGTNAPGVGLPEDGFSIRWEGLVEPRYSETYDFCTVSDDGVRLWVDGQQLIDNWTFHGVTEDCGSITLQAGQQYEVKMEYFDATGDAVARLLWSSPSQFKEVIPESQLFADEL
ncbi:MAG: heparin lyase I family protein [Chloroflexota bacterium]